jgi:flavodoxin
MKALIVYDSFFGNTEKIAQAIAAAMEATGEVQAIRAGETVPEQLQGLDLLVVGSPTRAFTMSEKTKEFLTRIPAGGLQGLKFAAFDTRMLPQDVNNAVYTFFSGVFGFAAPKIAKRLEKKGANLILPPEGFAVTGGEGPLKDGEVERASAWGWALLEKVS